MQAREHSIIWLVLCAGLAVVTLLGGVQPEVLAQASRPTPAPPALTPEAVSIPQSIDIEKHIDPAGQLQAGQDAMVTVRISGQASGDCFGVPAQPVDAVVLLDTSPSAGRPAPGSNLERAQHILRALWAQMDQLIYQTVDGEPAYSRLGIVTVDTGVTSPDEVNVRLPFTNSVTTIEAAIAGLENGADSGFDKGIKRAAQLLADQGRPDATHVLVVLLHDNYFALQDIVKAEINNASAQAQVFIIGNLLNVREAEQLTKEDATALVGSPEQVFLNPSAEDLRRLFVLASGSSPNVLGHVFRVYEELSPLDLVEVRKSDVENSGSLEGNRIVWDVNRLLVDAPLELRYHFRVGPGVSTSIQISTNVAFVDCNGFIHLDQKGEPVATQTIPVATPTPPVEATGTPTATPHIPAPESPTSPTPKLTPTPELCVINLGDFRLPCWLFWLLLLLPLSLVSIAIWLWLESRRRPVPPPTTEGTAVPPSTSISKERRKFEGRKPQSEGDIIRPGRARDDAALLKQLHAASSISGRIPAGESGFAKSRVVVRVFNSAKELLASGGLNVEAMGSLFWWQREEGDLRVRTALLQQVLCERVSDETPLLALWTREPADNADIEVGVKPNSAAKRIEIQARSTYRPHQPGQVAPEKAHWLTMRFLKNPGYKIVILPTIES